MMSDQQQQNSGFTLPPGYVQQSTSQLNNNNNNMQQNAKMEAAAQPSPGTLLTERDRAERFEDDKWKTATWGQTLCRGLQVMFAEALACAICAFLSQMAAATGLCRLSTALLEFFITVLIISRFTRENAGHLDPCVTAMLTIVGKIGLPWIYCLAYFIAQPIGWVLGTLFVWAITPGNDRSLGLGTPIVLGVGYTPGQSFAMEILGCCILFGTILHLVMADGDLNYYEQTSGKRGASFIFAVAAAKTAITFVGIPISGSSFGWYRYFFPAVISGTIDSSNWWISFVAPPIALIFVLSWWFLYNWIDNAAYQHAKESKKKYKTI